MTETHTDEGSPEKAPRYPSKKMEAFIDAVGQKYGLDMNTSPHSPYLKLDAQLRDLWEACGGFGDDFERIRGKRIVDLGCGSTRGQWAMEAATANDGHEIFWAPWFCRVLHEMGADVAGVDIAPNDGEEFEHHAADLRNPEEALSRFPDHSVDYVTTQAFWDAPELTQSRVASLPMKEGIITQAFRMLKPDGKFVSRETAESRDSDDWTGDVRALLDAALRKRNG